MPRVDNLGTIELDLSCVGRMDHNMPVQVYIGLEGVLTVEVVRRWCTMTELSDYDRKYGLNQRVRG